MKGNKSKLERMLCSLIALAVLISMIPVLFLICRAWPINFQNLYDNWTQDTLSYFAALISTLGTLFLGGVSYWQTRQIRSDEKQQELANTQRPFFVLESVTADQDKPARFDEGSYCVTAKRWITLKLKNFGEGPAFQVVHNALSHFDEDGLYAKEIPYAVPKDGEHYIKVMVPMGKKATNQEENFEIETDFVITYTNVIGFTYDQTIHIHTNPKQISDGRDFNAYENDPPEQWANVDVRISNISVQECKGMQEGKT